MDFCAGFMHEALSGRVVMVRKAKPAWQAGLLNGPGGKIDQYVSADDKPRLETPVEAMVREFQEEIGIATTPDEWRLVLYMQDPRDFYTESPGHGSESIGVVYWFAATRRFLPKLRARTDTGEEILTININEITARRDTVASVRWIIPMAFFDPTLQPLGSDERVLMQAKMATGAIGWSGHVPGCNPVPETDMGMMGLKVEFDPIEVELDPIRFEDFPNGRVRRPKKKQSVNQVDHTAYLRRLEAQYKRRYGPYNGIAVGDIVANRAGTEAGIVRAFGEDGKRAWVQSIGQPKKWVTLSMEDLILIGVSGVTGPTSAGMMPPAFGGITGPTGPSHPVGKLERDGVVSDTTGCGGRARPSHWRGTPRGAVGPGSPDIAIPAEFPDAEWLNNGAGAQEHF